MNYQSPILSGQKLFKNNCIVKVYLNLIHAWYYYLNKVNFMNKTLVVSDLVASPVCKWWYTCIVMKGR